jgi:hypothetical protein
LSLISLTFALAAQSCPAVPACPSFAPAPDAPSVEAARAWMQSEVDLAERHNNDAGPGLVNVTTGVTPEAEHVPTGARCRFWYRSADISFEFYDSRFLGCSTSLGWVSTGATLFHREPRPALHDAHYLAYARDPAAGPRDVAMIRAARTEMDSPGQTQSTVSPVSAWVTPAGHRIAYVSATIAYPGGGPDGTPQRRHSRFYVAQIGEWMLMYGADGPVHYRDALDGYAETGFRQLLESVEQAGRILPAVAEAGAESVGNLP